MQFDLFSPHHSPSGFQVYPSFITPIEEKDLLEIFSELHFKNFEMYGVEAKRKIIHYGMTYDFKSRSAVNFATPIPEWLVPIKLRAEKELKKEVKQALVTYYPIDSTIGWHKDAPPFESLFGFSLLGECRFKMRRGEVRNWENFETILNPRDGYKLEGPSRWEWQHSIPPVKVPRYSVTFRTLIHTTSSHAFLKTSAL